LNNDELARALAGLVREACATQGSLLRPLELPAVQENASALYQTVQGSAPLFERALTELEHLVNRAEALATLAKPTPGGSAPCRLDGAKSTD
jgi:hypothetical protein